MDFFDSCDSFEGYEISLIKKDNYVTFRLTPEEFELNEMLVNILEFLIKTNQWIPYAVYQDLFNLPEERYEELEYVDDINIYYMEYSLKLKKIGR